jgi:hypothetical protein
MLAADADDDRRLNLSRARDPCALSALENDLNHDLAAAPCAPGLQRRAGDSTHRPNRFIDIANPFSENALAVEGMSFEGQAGRNRDETFDRDPVRRSDVGHEATLSLSAWWQHTNPSSTEEDHGGETAEDGYVLKERSELMLALNGIPDGPEVMEKDGGRDGETRERRCA